MKRVIASAYVALFGIGLVATAQATPWFTQDPRTLPEGRWRAEEHVLASRIKHSLADGEEAPLPGGATEASALTLHTRVRYGARDNLTLFIDLPEVTKRVHTAAGVREKSGLGDILALAKLKYHDDRRAGTRRAVSVYYKTHTGEYKGLPNLLATGTGQDNLALLHLWEWDRGPTTWYASLGYVLTGERDDTARDPGDLAVFNLAAEHKLGRSQWNFVWEINGQHEGRAEQAGAPVAASGATVISLSPGFQYVQKRGNGRLTQWEAGVQLPVVKHGDLGALQDYTVYAGGYRVF